MALLETPSSSFFYAGKSFNHVKVDRNRRSTISLCLDAELHWTENLDNLSRVLTVAHRLTNMGRWAESLQ